MQKIYFAGSIRGGRTDAALYERIIEFLKRENRVLTEHVGSPALVSMEAGKKDVSIYEQDMSWLRESELVIAECTTPSLGVGYELAAAEHLGKPVHIFFNTGRGGSLSAMLTGDTYFRIHYYTEEAELFEILRSIV